MTGHIARNCPSNPLKEEGESTDVPSPEKKLPQPGRRWLSCNQSYTSVFCHVETLRSSLTPTSHLLQLAAVSSPPSTQGEFFRPIVPPDVTKYLDECNLGGDLLQAVHMTREHDTFHFRQRFDVSQDERIVCVSEDAALQDFFTFLESVGANVILVCVDEDTVATLLGKLKSLDRGRCLGLVQGYTWWRRIGRHLAVSGFRNRELVDFYHSSFPSAARPSLHTAPVVASMLKSCVGELVRRHCGMEPGSGQVVFLVAVSAQLRPRARVREVEDDREVLEVYSSFQPDLLTCITVETLEQLVVSSDSEEEYMEQRNVKPIKVEVKEEATNISSDCEPIFPPASLQHATGHPYRKTKIYNCKWCDKVIHSRNAIQRHIRRVHKMQKNLQVSHTRMEGATVTPDLSIANSQASPSLSTSSPFPKNLVFLKESSMATEQNMFLASTPTINSNIQEVESKLSSEIQSVSIPSRFHFVCGLQIPIKGFRSHKRRCKAGIAEVRVMSDGMDCIGLGRGRGARREGVGQFMEGGRVAPFRLVQEFWVGSICTICEEEKFCEIQKEGQDLGAGGNSKSSSGEEEILNRDEGHFQKESLPLNPCPGSGPYNLTLNLVCDLSLPSAWYI